MSRNDIRLRRRTMTSRRIERHKNYGDLMKRHRRQSLARTVFKWVALGLVILLSVFLYMFFKG